MEWVILKVYWHWSLGVKKPLGLVIFRVNSIYMKRFLDLVFSFLALIVFSPVFLIIVIAVIFDSGFPVFFIQQRIGVRGKIFNIIKFRTMTASREHRHGSFDVGDSSRVTKVGKLLRRTKLDELPQLLNVFLGEMSFVGPRPEVKKWVEAYPKRWEKVLTVRPGITDNASIEFRNEEEILKASSNPLQTYYNVILPSKLDLYESYVDNQSLRGDLSIIIRTVITVIFK